MSGDFETYNVQSSNIESVGYNPESKELLVCFKNGYDYRYYGVPIEEFQELLAAGSKGKYLNAHIKDKYRYKKVGD